MFRYAPKLLKLIRLAAVAGAAFGIIQAVMRCRKKTDNASTTATTWPSLADTDGGTDMSNASPPDDSSKQAEADDHSDLSVSSVSQEAEQLVDAESDSKDGNDIDNTDIDSTETESAASDHTEAASESGDDASDVDTDNDDTKGSS